MRQIAYLAARTGTQATATEVLSADEVREPESFSGFIKIYYFGEFIHFYFFGK